MKRIVEDTGATGLESLLGERVLLMCSNYFYCGKLAGVSKTFVELHDAAIVYDTGDWSNAKYSDMQALGKEPHYVRIQHVESYRKAK